VTERHEETDVDVRPDALTARPEARLDEADQCLWLGDERVSLTPKAYALLVYLAARPRRLVTKRELLDRLWSGTVVTDGVLKVCVRELRVALRDDARQPRWIETRHRRGYAFLRELPRRAAEPGAQAPQPLPRLGAAPPEPEAPFVGREAELAELERAMERVLAGQREVVFVTGAPGMGKTALVETFLRGVEAHVLVARGQGLESFGAGEAYLPVLDALGRLGRGPHRERLKSWLERSAPTWLVQLPALADASERERLAREILGATRERMLREMAEALEALTQETPFVFLLEDLHWSDPSTLDLIALLARRGERARLLFLLTCRPGDASVPNQALTPLKRELVTRKLAREIVLRDLDLAALERYLAARFPGRAPPAALARALHGRTQGHPLFFVRAVDSLLEKGLLRVSGARLELACELEVLAREVPESIRDVLELELARLTEREQRVLEAAAIAGLEFSSAAVASGLGLEPSEVEESCDELARRGQVLRPAGIGRFPDGSLSARYTFTHGLYADVLGQRAAPARRARLHQRIGVRGEELYGKRVVEIAAELALHFEEGRDFARAVRYRELAAENDARRYANREATAQLELALRLAERLPTDERTDASLRVLEALGSVRRSMGDMDGSAEAFEGLVATAREHGRHDAHARGLLYLASALFWVDRQRCLAAVDRALETCARIAQVSSSDELLVAHVRGYCGHWNLNLRGFEREHVLASERALEAVERGGDPKLRSLHLVRLAYARFLESRYAEAVEACDQGAELALVAGDAFEWLLATFFRAWALLHAGRWAEMDETLEQGLAMAEKNGHRSWSMLFSLERAQLASAALDFERALGLAREVLSEAQASPEPTGQIRFHGWIALAQALVGLSRLGEARATLDELERELARKSGLMDWMLYLPLLACEAECRLGEHDLDGARSRADELAARAQQSGERTYQVLALDLHARIARAGGERDAAYEALASALALGEAHDLPLARLRALRTAREQRDEPARGPELGALLGRLTAGLRGDSGLRERLEERVLRPVARPARSRTRGRARPG
jgi:DNA-binding winged helix-turn-helix (wHTH) protein